MNIFEAPQFSIGCQLHLKLRFENASTAKKLFQPIVNNFQPFFVTPNLSKNTFEASATPNVVVNPLERTTDLDDYAAQIEKLGKSNVGFAQLNGDEVYLSASHALCDGGFLRHFVDVVLPKLVKDTSFRGEMAFPPDILQKVSSESAGSVAESSVLALHRDKNLQADGVNTMQYCAFDLAFQHKMTPKLLVALSLAVEKANSTNLANSGAPAQDLVIGANLMVDTRQHVKSLESIGLLNCVAQMNVGQVVSGQSTVAEALERVRSEIDAHLSRREYLSQYQQNVDVEFCPEAAPECVPVELSNVGSFLPHQWLTDADLLCTASMDCASLSLIASGYGERVHCRLYYSQTFISPKDVERFVRNFQAAYSALESDNTLDRILASLE